MEDVLIFANPIAGRGRAQDVAHRLEQRLGRAGFAVHVFFEPALQIPPDRLSCSRTARACIAIGGDGTLRAAAERLLACNPDGTIPPLVVIPFGTANLMGRHLGLSWRDDSIDQQVLEAILHGSIRHLDAARANGMLFLLVAGVGIDAQIIHLLEDLRKGPIGIPTYLAPAAMALWKYTYEALTVEVDGRRVFGPEPGVAFVGNTSEYGTYFPILPHARSDDGLLDVCALPCRSPTDVCELFLHAAAGDHLHVEGVVYVKGAHARIESAKPLPVQIDGEAAGFTPLEVDLIPAKLPFIVPP